jgi:hypothetical protein
VDIEGYRTGAPRGALTWETAAQRSRKLREWQRGVLATFGEQARAVRLAWVLSNLFNTKTGYCFASNGMLADMTVMAENKVRATRLILEQGRAIVRGSITHANGRKQRIIYPATAIVPRPTSGRGGEPQQMGLHTLKRGPRLPKTQWEAAARAAQLRQQRERRERDEGRLDEGDLTKGPGHAISIDD